MKLSGWKIVGICFAVLFLMYLSYQGARDHLYTQSSVPRTVPGKELREKGVVPSVRMVSPGTDSVTGQKTKLPVEDCLTCPDLKRLQKLPEGNQFQDCQEFLQGAAADGIPDPDGSHLGGCNQFTPLHVTHNIAEVRGLIEAGADPNVQDWFGRTPLHHAVIQFKDPEIVTTLLEAGADPDIQDDGGHDVITALRQRPNSEQRRLVGILLQDEITAERLGVTIEEYYAQHPSRKALVAGYSDRTDIADIRLQVQLSKAGKSGRMVRILQELAPAELIALREEFAIDPQTVIKKLERGLE